MSDRIRDLILGKIDKYDSDMEGADHDAFIRAEWASGAMRQLLKEFDAAKRTPKADDDLTAAYMAGSASRLDELRAKDAEIAALKHDLERTRDERNRARLEEQRKWMTAQPDLQPLHALVRDWTATEPFTIAAICRLQLSEAIAKIQSAGAGKS